MNYFTKFIRTITKWSFQYRDLATIRDIPTDIFNSYIDDFIQDDWIKYFEYSGFDAWIDYGCIKLRKEKLRLKFEWDNWEEGSIEGPKPVIQSIAEKYNLTVSNEWRWS